MENLNELKPVGKLSPFGHFCCTIGHLPTSYMISLTYEEQLLWLCQYLEKTVIPAVNTNAEAVAELQALYIQLKDYVDNYFTNLDVQQEINKKLDEMAEDGTLAQIINQYISNCILSFKNVESMKASEYALENSICRTLGYYNENDNGGSYYLISSTHLPYSITLNNGLYANFINPNNREINIKQFGVIGDGLTDDTTSFTNVLNYIKNIGGSITNNDTVLLKSSISIEDFTANCNLLGNGSFIFDLTAIAQNGLYIKTTAEFNVLGNLKFDFKNQCFNGLHIVSTNPLNNCKIFGEYRNIRRANINFSGGNIIYIHGGFNNVEIQAIAENALMAEGAGIAGSQGIAGISVVTYEENEITYVPKVVKIKNGTIINNVHSEDTSYTSDQDGLKVFGDDNSVLIVESGVVISDCAGRWVKTQTGYSDISGSYYANNYFPIVCGISVQFGRCNIHNCNFFNNIEQDFTNFGTCMINFATNPNIDSTTPTDSSFIHDINYFAPSSSSRIRKFLLLTGRTNHVLSNLFINNIAVHGALQQFAQIQSFNTSLSTEVNFSDIYLQSLVNYFIDLTNIGFDNITYVNLAFNNILIGNHINDLDLIHQYTDTAYAYCNSCINCKPFKNYSLSNNVITENENKFINTKNYITNINFKQNQDLFPYSTSEVLQLTGDNYTIPSSQSHTFKLAGFNDNVKNNIVFIISPNYQAFGIFNIYNDTITPLSENNLNINTSGSSGIVINIDDNKDLVVTNHFSGNAIIDFYNFS